MENKKKGDKKGSKGPVCKIPKSSFFKTAPEPGSSKEEEEKMRNEKDVKSPEVTSFTTAPQPSGSKKEEKDQVKTPVVMQIQPEAIAAGASRQESGKKWKETKGKSTPGGAGPGATPVQQVSIKKRADAECPKVQSSASLPHPGPSFKKDGGRRNVPRRPEPRTRLRSSKEEDKKEKDKEEVKSFATPSQLVPSKKGDDGKKKVPESLKMQPSATHLQPRLDQKEYRKQKGGKGSGSFATPRQAQSSHRRNEKEKFPGGSEVRTAPWSRSGTGQVAVSFGQEPGRRWGDRRPPPQLKYIPPRGPPSHTGQQRFGARPRLPKLMIPEPPRTEGAHQRQLQDPSLERRIRGQLPQSSHCSTATGHVPFLPQIPPVPAESPQTLPFPIGVAPPPQTLLLPPGVQRSPACPSRSVPSTPTVSEKQRLPVGAPRAISFFEPKQPTPSQGWYPQLEELFPRRHLGMLPPTSPGGPTDLEQSTSMRFMVPEPAVPSQVERVSTILAEPLKALSLEEVKEGVTLGTTDKKIQLETNHFRVNLGDITHAFRYEVEIQSKKITKGMARKVMEEFRKKYYPENYPNLYQRKILYSAKKLPFEGNIHSGTVQCNERKYSITVVFNGTVDLSPLRNLQQRELGKDEAFQLVEDVFRQSYISSFISSGSRFYSKSNQLSKSAQLYSGGHQELSKGWVPFLNVDSVHVVLTSEVPLVEVVKEICNDTFHVGSTKGVMSKLQVEEVDYFLRGMTVKYRRKDKEPFTTFTVVGLKGSASEVKFLYKEEELSVQKYFRTKLGVELEHPELPTLWVGSKEKTIYLPVECCVLVGGQPINHSKVLESLKAGIIRGSTMSSLTCKTKIQKIKAQLNDNPCVKEFGFSVADQFEKVEGRVLEPPVLQYSETLETPNNGAWRTHSFLKPRRIEMWRVVAVGQQSEDVSQMVTKLTAMLMDEAPNYGMRFAVPLQWSAVALTEISLRKFFRENWWLQVLIVVLPSDKWGYFQVKQYAELSAGCLTQCIKMDTIRRMDKVIAKYLLLKINSKTNGVNHTIANLPLVTHQPCMVMGATMTPPKTLKTPILVAVTASEDLTATTYNTTFTLQNPKKSSLSTIEQLKTITIEKLRAFVARNNAFPARIYYYRESAIDKIEEEEAAAIKSACAAVSNGSPTALTMVLVRKSHHTRFFFEENATVCNPPPGTCVDSVVTDPTAQNFYLQSHGCAVGVAKPTRYRTIYDDNNLTNDEVQRLTHHLCYLGARCDFAVSRPAPVYYAQLAAERAKAYLAKAKFKTNQMDLNPFKMNETFTRKHPMFFI